MGRMIILALVPAMLTAAPAFAQVTTCTVNPYKVTGNVECYTPAPPPNYAPPPPAAGSYCGLVCIALILHGQHQAKKAREEQERAAAAFRGSVIDAMNSGRCDEARNGALQAGDYQLASFVTQNCHSPQRPLSVSNPSSTADLVASHRCAAASLVAEESGDPAQVAMAASCR